MASIKTDRLVGLGLLAFAIAWTGVVYVTIPVLGGPGEFGPRAFPLLFGIALGICAILMLAGTYIGQETEEEAGSKTPDDRNEYIGVIATLFAILIYGFAMQRIGFLVSTPIFVAALLYFLLKVRKPVFIAAFAIGLTAGTYIVFNKLLGAYLPPGTWITVIL